MKTQEWTTEQWDNLHRLSTQLTLMLAAPKNQRQNAAWQAKLRIVIGSIAMYEFKHTERDN